MASSYQLDKRLRNDSENVSVCAVHPGIVRSRLWQNLSWFSSLLVAIPSLLLYLVSSKLGTSMSLLISNYVGSDVRQPVFVSSDKARFKPACSSTETSLKIEISLVASPDIILFKKQITTALIRLRECTGWSAPLLIANPHRQVFSHQGPCNSSHDIESESLSCHVLNLINH